MTTLIFASLLATAASVVGRSPTVAASGPGSTSTVAGLNFVAQSIGKTYFGSATDNSELTDTPYIAILSDFEQFGQITPENSMKWDAIEPEQGVFDFTGGDQIAELAQQNGQIIRGHNLVWSSQLPSWVTDTEWTPEELTAVIQNHVTTEVSHYKGQIFAWDVVNEPFNDNGTFENDVFFSTLGVSYISIALEAARAADPNARLYINDFNIETAGVKATAMQNLISELKANGTPIDGVGFESHFILGEVPTDIQETMEAFVALGVEVAITELDIRMALPESDALLEQQKTEYTSVIQACVAVEDCVGITVWDFTDKFTWVNGTFPGFGVPCPWDGNLVKKPAFDGIVIGFTS